MPLLCDLLETETEGKYIYQCDKESLNGFVAQASRDFALVDVLGVPVQLMILVSLKLLLSAAF